MSLQELDKDAYLALAKELVGRTIERVTYVGMEDGPSHETTEHGHAVYQGVDLTMADGTIWGFTWGSSTPVHLRILRVSATSEIGHPRTWDVTADPQWHPLLGRRVNDAQIGWQQEHGWSGKLEVTGQITGWEPFTSPMFAQDLELSFEDRGCLWLSTLDDDSIHVIFEESVAQSIKIGRFAETRTTL